MKQSQYTQNLSTSATVSLLQAFANGAQQSNVDE